MLSVSLVWATIARPSVGISFRSALFYLILWRTKPRFNRQHEPWPDPLPSTGNIIGFSAHIFLPCSRTCSRHGEWRTNQKRYQIWRPVLSDFPRGDHEGLKYYPTVTSADALRQVFVQCRRVLEGTFLLPGDTSVWKISGRSPSHRGPGPEGTLQKAEKMERISEMASTGSI